MKMHQSLKDHTESTYVVAIKTFATAVKAYEAVLAEPGYPNRDDDWHRRAGMARSEMQTATELLRERLRGDGATDFVRGLANGTKDRAKYVVSVDGYAVYLPKLT
jgi:hypothetical protein